MGILGFLILIPILLFIPGFLLLEIINNESLIKSKKIAYAFVLSLSISISTSYFLTKISEIINYQIFIYILIIITLIFEGIILFKLLKEKDITKIKEEIQDSFDEFKKKIRTLLDKKKLKYTLIFVLISISMCFPLFFPKNEPFFVFQFNQEPPLIITESSIDIEVSITHLPKQNRTFFIEVLINGSLFLEESTNCSESDTTDLAYKLDFSQNGTYFLTFNFYLLKTDNPSVMLGYLQHRVEVVFLEV